MQHDDAAKLAGYARYPLDGKVDGQDGPSPKTFELYRTIFKQDAFKEKAARFLAEEGVIAILEPGGSGGRAAGRH